MFTDKIHFRISAVLTMHGYMQVFELLIEFDNVNNAQSIVSDIVCMNEPVAYALRVQFYHTARKYMKYESKNLLFLNKFGSCEPFVTLFRLLFPLTLTLPSPLH